MSWWRYRGQCTGRVLHFLYHYCGFDVAEHATISDGSVTLSGKRIATFVWSTRFGEADVPEFVFLCECAEQCAERQRTKRDDAILDALPEAPEQEARKPVDEDVLRALIPNAVRSMRLRAQMVHKADAVYVTAPDGERRPVLWCKAGPALYYWHREIGAWLRGPVDDDGGYR